MRNASGRSGGFLSKYVTINLVMSTVGLPVSSLVSLVVLLLSPEEQFAPLRELCVGTRAGARSLVCWGNAST